MSRHHLLITFVLTILPQLAIAQPRGAGGRPPGGPPGFRIMAALDANRDGKISSKEIMRATVALLKLDANKDGKLSAAEIGWPPTRGFLGFFGRGGRPGGRGGRGGFPGGGFFGFGGPPDDTPKRRPDPDRDRDALSLAKPFFSLKQLRSLDRNKDGTIETKEIPKGLRKIIFKRLDKNNDGKVDAAELKQLKP